MTGRGKLRASGLAPFMMLVVLAVTGCTDNSQPSASHHHRRSASAPRSSHRVAKTRLDKHSPKPKPAVRRTRSTRARLLGVPAVDVPNRALTPGAVLTTSRARVCTPGYASSVRNVPTSESDAVYARYHVAHVPYAHEVDHLISLELGGSNAITNLWPEPYAGRWGARTKDTLENKLHDLVCAGQLSLPRAQHLEAATWVATYRRYLGAPPAPTTRATKQPTTSGGTTGAGCEPGYSPCLPRVADLDCADIPASKKPVRVTGTDPYRLDANHDGWGCTSS